MDHLLKQQEIEKLQNTFKTHPIFSTCYKVFMPRMAWLNGLEVTPDDVFYESARLLDFLLAKPDLSQHQVDSLWNKLLIDIRKWKPDATDHDKRMVAGTVFQIVRATLTQHTKSCYCETICDLLDQTTKRELKGSDEHEMAEFNQRLVEQCRILCEWINSYDEANEWLSDQIADIIGDKADTTVKKKETAKKTEKRGQNYNRKSFVAKPKTLKYYTHSNKGVLSRQRNRVNLVFKKWNEWGWLDNQTTANDFDAFFEGEPRHCNIVFKKNTTVLSVFLRDLLDYENSHKEKIISKQTGQSATSLVKEQFGKTENFDETRLTDDDRFKIEATLYILNTENPIVHRQGGDDNDYDTSDAAFQAVFSGQLRSTKGI